MEPLSSYRSRFLHGLFDHQCSPLVLQHEGRLERLKHEEFIRDSGGRDATDDSDEDAAEEYLRSSKPRIEKLKLELARRDAITMLRTRIEQLLICEANTKRLAAAQQQQQGQQQQQRPPPPIPVAEIRRVAAQIVPLWTCAFHNSEWLRREPLLVPPQKRKHGGSSSGATRRSWVCPLMDAGRRVVVTEPNQQQQQHNNDGGDQGASFVVADELPPNDDSVVLFSASSTAPVKVIKPLAAVALAEPVLFSRDTLIPNVEDEPAARCGNAVVFAKLKFDLKISDASDLNKVMRGIGEVAAEMRLRVAEFQAAQKAKNNHDEEAGQEEEPDISYSVDEESKQVTITLASANTSWALPAFHFIKLLILWLFYRRNCEETLCQLFGLLDNISDYETAQAIQRVMDENNEADVLRACLADICTCLQRYANFDGDGGTLGNLHAAIHPAFVTALKPSVELFANPFNASTPVFCSLFRDTDAVFGSAGSCFDFLAQGGLTELTQAGAYQRQNNGGGSANDLLLVANPPFDVGVVRRLARALRQAFSAYQTAAVAAQQPPTANNNIRPPLVSVAIIIPVPRTDVSAAESKYQGAVDELLDRNVMCIGSTQLAPSEAAYVRGQQQTEKLSETGEQLTVGGGVAAEGDDDEDEEDWGLEQFITIQRSTYVITVCSDVRCADGVAAALAHVQESAQAWKAASEMRERMMAGKRRKRSNVA